MSINPISVGIVLYIHVRVYTCTRHQIENGKTWVLLYNSRLATTAEQEVTFDLIVLYCRVLYAFMYAHMCVHRAAIVFVKIVLPRICWYIDNWEIFSYSYSMWQRKELKKFSCAPNISFFLCENLFLNLLPIVHSTRKHWNHV